MTVSGSVTATQGFTGSLFGTASWANNSSTASFAPSYVLISQTSSMSVLSASFATTASYVNPLFQNIIITGSISISGSTIQTGSFILNNNAGTVTTFTGDPFTFDRAGNTLSFFAAAGGVGNNSVIYSSTVLRLGGGSNAAQLVLDSSGNKTGINKASPNSALDVNGNTNITGSLTVSQGITGSLFGTSSWSQNAISSSYVLNAVSASYAATAALAPNYVLTSVTSSMNVLSSSFATTSSFADNFTVKGTLTAQTIVVQTITSSIDYITGSTRFGSLSTDTHVFTGSVKVTGSLTGSLVLAEAINFSGSASPSVASTSYVFSNQNVGLFNDFSTTQNGSSAYTYNGALINPRLVNTAVGTSATSLIGIASQPVISSSQNTSNLSIIGISSLAQRGSSADLSTSSSNNLSGIQSLAGHAIGLPSASSTSTVYGVTTNILNQGGTISTAQGNRVAINIANGVGATTASIANAFGYYVQGNIGGNAPGTITNAYAFYMNPLNVNTFGTVTNRWGIYIADGVAKNHISGTLLLGDTVDNASGILQVTGNARITGSLTVTQGITGSLFGTSSWSQNAISASYVTGSIYTSANPALSASYALTASYALNSGGGSGLRTKAGSIANTSFTGNPDKATVTFSTAFADANYAIIVTGEDARSWTIESKAAGSFIINSNSNVALLGTTYWIATAYGETI